MSERARTTTGLALAAVVLAGLATVPLPPGRDQAIYTAVGSLVHDGRVLYRDAFDFKPPAIHLVYAAAAGFGRHAWTAVRFFDLASLLAAAVLLARLVEGGAARAIAVLVFGLSSTLLFRFWDLAQPEGFLVAPVLGALVAWRVARRSRAAAAGAGALLGLAALFKYPAALFVLLLPLVEQGTPSAPVPRARQWMFLLLGFVVLVGAGLGALAASGAWSAFWEIHTRYLPGYTGLVLADGFGTAVRASAGLAREFFVTRPVLVAGVVASIALAARPRHTVDRVPLVGALIAALGVALQGKFFHYHWIPMVPFLAWGTGVASERLVRAAAARRGSIAAGGLSIALMLLFVLSARPVWPERVATMRRLFGGLSREAFVRSSCFGAVGVGDYSAGATLEAAAALRRETMEGSSLFVWGFEPLLYADTGRTPVSRFLYTAPLQSPWCPRPWIDEIVATLRRRPPDTFVVVREDAIPWVTGVPFDSRDALRYFPDVVSLLREEYEPAGEVEHFSFFRKRR